MKLERTQADLNKEFAKIGGFFLSNEEAKRIVTKLEEAGRVITDANIVSTMKEEAKKAGKRLKFLTGELATLSTPIAERKATSPKKDHPVKSMSFAKAADDVNKSARKFMATST